MDAMKFTQGLNSIFGKPSNKSQDDHRFTLGEIASMAEQYSDEVRAKAYSEIITADSRSAFPKLPDIRKTLSKHAGAHKTKAGGKVSQRAVFNSAAGQWALNNGCAADFWVNCENDNKVLSIDAAQDCKRRIMASNSALAEVGRAGYAHTGFIDFAAREEKFAVNVRKKFGL